MGRGRQCLILRPFCQLPANRFARGGLAQAKLARAARFPGMRRQHKAADHKGRRQGTIHQRGHCQRRAEKQGTRSAQKLISWPQ